MLAFEDFSGGLWIPDEAGSLAEQAGFAVPPNALLEADNLDYLPSGAVRGRRGSRRYNENALPGSAVALHRYYGRPVPAYALGAPTARTLAEVGSVEWENPAGVIYPVDPSFASADVLDVAQTHYLFVAAPFTSSPIPANAIITGIKVQVTGRCATTSVAAPIEASIRLIRDYAAAGGDKSTGEALTELYEPTTYGGTADLWGTTWSAAQINDPGFGVGLSYQANGAANRILIGYVTIHVYYSASEADAFIAAHTAGGSLVYSRGTGTGFTTITGGTLANPSLRPRIVAWPQKGKLFCFDGTNPVTEYNGVDMQTTPTRKDDLGIYEYIPPRRGPYACLHKNRIFATDPGELAFSVYACDVNDETTWRPQVQLAANDERGGAITGLASYGDALIIFKNTCLFRFLGDPEFGAAQLSRYSEVGCVAPDSIQVTPFGVIFVGREGVWLTDGENVTLLSRAIRPLFVGRDSETLHTDAVGVYYPRREQYWLKLSPASDGYVLQRVAILTEGGETTQLAWSRIPSLNMNCGAVWGSAADDGQLYLGDQIGFVWLRDVGADDNGSSYTTGILTSQRYVHERRLEGRINRLKPLYRGAAPLTGAVRYDQAATDDVAFTAGATLASPAVQEPRTYLADQASFGRFISVRCESSEGPEFELHRIDADTRVRGGRAWG